MASTQDNPPQTRPDFRHESEDRFRALFELAPVGHALSRMADGRFIEANQAFLDIVGRSQAELVELSHRDLTPPEYAAEEARQLAVLEATGRYGPYEKEYLHRDGHRVPVLLHGALIVSPCGERQILSVVQDGTRQKANEAHLRLMGTVFEHSSEAILVTDHQQRIIAVNPAFTELTGYRPDEVLGRNPRLLASGHTPASTYTAMWTGLIQENSWQGEVWDRRKDGSVYPKWLSIAVATDETGQITHYIANFTDLTERREAAERIAHLATHDTLTGLPNRFALESQIRHALKHCQRECRQLAVFLIDLDGFKNINDSLGHHLGDQVLIEAAGRLTECVRSSDIVARLGGDEFVVVLPDIEHAMTAANIAGKIQRGLADSYLIGGNELYATPSIGISIYPGDGEDAEMLLRNADTAMYHAKGAGRNNHQFYTASMNEAAAERLRMENALRQALATTHGTDSQFTLHFQPLLHVESGRIASVEALVRWTHPTLGAVPPARFIPIAEETGLIQPLGDWVFWEACRQLKEFHRQGLAGLRMAVNLSAQQLRHESLPAVVRGALACYELQPGDLELEITESTAMQNPEITLRVLDQLAEMGITLAIDDFGTGYSSLAYLRDLPIHRLKLDRSFVTDIETDASDAAICSATVALGHNLGLELVAEGVETSAQRDFLTKLGCDMLQGYLYSRPLPGPALLDYLRRGVATAATE